jgi:outer membrane protein assembly factor BamB
MDSSRVRLLHIGAMTDPVPPHRISCLDPTGAVIFDCLAVPAFRASPVVSRGKLYIGSTNGRLYAYDANTLQSLWQYPPAKMPALQSSFDCGALIPSSFGIAASATIAQVQGQRAVIFAAPDRTSGNQNGEGYLFAVHADTGTLIWKSAQPIARVTGRTPGSFQELHEKTGYSSPIVWNDRVYIGINDHCDNPIQKGRVVAVDLNTGAIISSFQFCSAGPCNNNDRGGGVWSSPAVWDGDLIVTTGNVNLNPNNPKLAAPQPQPNYGLSLLRLNGATGAVMWSFQPVPYALDQDPDWAAGATVMSASCGTRILSTMKDGWTYAIDQQADPTPLPSGDFIGVMRWKFPPGPPVFSTGDGTFHGDTQYKRPGASWGDVYVTTTAGYQASTSSIRQGYRRLYAFNVCASNNRNRVRWILDVPDVSGDCNSPPPFNPPWEHAVRDCLGPPTITGGVVYVGTVTGHLVVAADPSLPGVAQLARCSHPDFPLAVCAGLYPIVHAPEVLANVTLDGTPILTEPVLAGGKVYVATDGGRVYLLERSASSLWRYSVVPKRRLCLVRRPRHPYHSRSTSTSTTPPC